MSSVSRILYIWRQYFIIWSKFLSFKAILSTFCPREATFTHTGSKYISNGTSVGGIESYCWISRYLSKPVKLNSAVKHPVTAQSLKQSSVRHWLQYYHLFQSLYEGTENNSSNLTKSYYWFLRKSLKKTYNNSEQLINYNEIIHFLAGFE